MFNVFFQLRILIIKLCLFKRQATPIPFLLADSAPLSLPVPSLREAANFLPFSLSLFYSQTFLSPPSFSPSLPLSPLFLSLHNPLNKYSTSLGMAYLSMSLSLARPPFAPCLGPATARGPAAISAWDWLLSGPSAWHHMA